MSTNSRIGVMHGEKCKSVHCHWDGYLAHNGAILQEHYDSARANHLVALGNLSSLGRVIGEAHPFSPHTSALDKLAYEAAHEAGHCTFYTRDRGEKLVVHKFADFEDYLAHHAYEEYEYILRNDNGVAVWFVDCGATGYVTLETALINEREAA